MKVLILFAFLGLSAAMDMEKSEKSEDKPQEKLIDDVVPSEIWIMSAVEVAEEDLHKAYCPGGVPAHKACEKDGDCLIGFACLGEESSKYCCIEEEVLQFAACPAPMTPAANKWCSEDSDCGDKAKCVMEFAAPDEWIEERNKAHPELKDHKHEVGICCSDDLSHIPEGVASCPEEQSPFRRGPCGLGIEGCPLGSNCWYSEGLMGRCCGSALAGAKTGSSFHYGRRGYYGRGYGYGYGRRYYGGYGRHRGYGRHYGGYGRRYGGYRRYGRK